jgi:hypothetical protein
VSGISTALFKADANMENLVVKLRKAVRGVVTEGKPDESWLIDIKSRRRKQFKLSNLGWQATPREKSLIVVKLASPILCGITMDGGVSAYERILVSNDEGGEWYSRQLINEAESAFLISVGERLKKSESVNVVMAGVRGLSRVVEFDECLMRMTRTRYQDFYHGGIGVFFSVMSHEFRDPVELKEEPILFVCLLDGDLKGADVFGGIYTPLSKGETVTKQVFGTIETQLFRRVDTVVNRLLRSASGSWMIEIDGVPKGSSMVEVLALLNDDEVSRAMALVRMDSEYRTNQMEKWCILMYTRGNGTVSKEVGSATIREKHIVSPTRRERKTGKWKSRHPLDECNLRFFEKTGGERSESRDRVDPPTWPIAPSGPTSSMAPSYQPQARSRPVSLLQSPVQSNLQVIGGSKGGNIGSSQNVDHSLVHGKKKCSHFVRGFCRDGMSCKFLHGAGGELDHSSINNDQK